MQISIEKIDQFLVTYRARLQSISLQRWENDQSRFEKVLAEVRQLHQTHLIEEKQTASNYNIFEILNIHTLETVTHTPFLANLLDVKGSHGQGTLFYKSFIEHIFRENKKEVMTFLPPNEDYLSCYQEYSSGNGFIDIFIHSRNRKKPFAIVIENKIYARDQKDQLKRYYKFVTDQLRIDEENLLLVYLTIDGRTLDSEYSIDQKTVERLRRKGRFFSMSYQKDISTWLKGTLSIIEAPGVQEIIHQYSSILQKL